MGQREARETLNKSLLENNNDAKGSLYGQTDVEDSLSDTNKSKKDEEK